MSTQQVANRLVALCRQGQFNEAYHELFDQKAVAIEPEGAPNQRVEGRDKLLQKSQGFAQDIKEMHSFSVSEPVVSSDHFAVSMKMDLTSHSRGRNEMDEICVYQVKDGKIVQEQFFYPMPT